MATLVGILVFVLLTFIFLSKLKPPPPIENEEQLRAQGFTTKEAKREARAQRAEHRRHTRAIASSLKSFERLGRSASRVIKKL